MTPYREHSNGLIVDLPDDWDGVWAMPSARATHASHRAVLRRLGQSVGIAIAVFCVVYFGLQLIRGWVS